MEGKRKELKELNRLIEEQKKSLAATSTTSISHMDIKSVVEKNQSWSAVDVEMKPVNDNDKNILNQNGSLYMMTKKKYRFYCSHWFIIY